MKRLVAVLILLVVTRAHATVIQVSTTADVIAKDGGCSLREALLAAKHNRRTNECKAGSKSGRDVILLPSGVFLLETPLTIDSQVTL